MWCLLTKTTHLCFRIYLSPTFPMFRFPQVNEHRLKGESLLFVSTWQMKLSFSLTVSDHFGLQGILIYVATCGPSCLQWTVILPSTPDQNTHQQGVLFILPMSNEAFCKMWGVWSWIILSVWLSAHLNTISISLPVSLFSLISLTSVYFILLFNLIIYLIYVAQLMWSLRMAQLVFSNTGAVVFFACVSIWHFMN